MTQSGSPARMESEEDEGRDLTCLWSDAGKYKHGRGAAFTERQQQTNVGPEKDTLGFVALCSVADCGRLPSFKRSNVRVGATPSTVSPLLNRRCESEGRR